MANVNGQLEKNDMTKVAMQKLCDALKTQVTLKDEENNLKLQEETQKRIDITKNFESTMTELTKLIEVHSKHNTSLREENKMMATKLEELLAEFEGRENKIHVVNFLYKHCKSILRYFTLIFRSRKNSDSKVSCMKLKLPKLKWRRQR